MLKFCDGYYAEYLRNYLLFQVFTFFDSLGRLNVLLEQLQKRL